jgi:NACHT domain
MSRGWMSWRPRYRAFRVAAAAAVATVVVGSLAWIVTADSEDSAKYGGAAALLVAVVTLGFEIVTFLRQPEGVRPSIEELADDLAATVEDQWFDEAAARRLRDPHVLPLGWSLTERNVSDSLESITSVPSGGRVTAARFTGRIGDNFDEAIGQLAESFGSVPNRRLVVIGEPGAGKTVLALLLTLGLLRSRGRGEPVPVLLPASSWDPVTEPFDTWIARTLATSFYSGRADAVDRLLKRQLVLPIVDGLDEISENSRRVAIREINDSLYQGRAIVVTCRAVEYQDLVNGGAPRLRGASVVEVTPLSGNDVVAYLKAVQWPQGVSWAEVYALLQARSDSPLRAAMSTPLMVSMARMVFERLGGDPGELANEQRFSSRHAIEDHVTGLVIDAAYAPGTTRTRRGRWDSVKAKRWLAFLAQYLHQHRERELAWWSMSQRLLGAWVGLAIGVITGIAFMIVASVWLAIANQTDPGWSIYFGYIVPIGVVTVSNWHHDDRPSRLRDSGPEHGHLVRRDRPSPGSALVRQRRIVRPASIRFLGRFPHHGHPGGALSDHGRH